MTSFERSLALASLLLAAVPCAVSPATAAELRIGGALGFGVSAWREPGVFRWDFDPAQAETTLAVLKLGGTAQNLSGFVSVGARIADDPDGAGPRFLLREASIVGSWPHAARDSLTLRLFARQPQSLWVESPFGMPIAVAAAGPDASGGRADAVWGPATAALVVAARGTLFEPAPRATLPAWDPPFGDLMILRLRGDALRWGMLRVGATWKRWHPDQAFSAATPPLDADAYDVFGVDARGGWRGVFATAELTGTHSEGTFPTVDAVGQRSGGPVTRALPTTSALRAELRSRAIPLGRWGALGFAPQYLAVGRDHLDRLVEADRLPGRSRRGVEGYRLEAWYDFPGWPAWARYAYDRSQQFRDADRRVIEQLSEVHAQLTDDVRAAVRYVQRDDLFATALVRQHHDDLVATLEAEDGGARFRLQGGIVDLRADDARSVMVLETAAHIGSRVQAVSRVSAADEGGRLRGGFFAGLEYWHLPQFELALGYGSAWLADGAWPALDDDLTADGRNTDRVWLHFQGWF